MIVPLRSDNFFDYWDQIAEIEKASFLTPWSEKAFLGELSNRYSHMWIYVHDGKVLGYICFWSIMEEVHLLNVAVHPAFRRRGIARSLLKMMLEECINEGAEFFWLEVRPSNSAAVALYRDLGFVETGRRRLYYRETGEDAILMGLKAEDLKAGTRGTVSEVLTAEAVSKVCAYQ